MSSGYERYNINKVIIVIYYYYDDGKISLRLIPRNVAPTLFSYFVFSPPLLLSTQ